MFQENEKMHNEAMSNVDQAELLKRQGNRTESLFFLRKAFEQERECALSLLHNQDFEPSRSILFRSAASLGLEVGEIREAEQLIYMGLLGNPPKWVEEELKNLYEDINLYRHYRFDNSFLENDEFEMVLEGDAVGYGICDYDEFYSRVENIKKLLLRTAQRKMAPEEPYKDKIPKSITSRMKAFMKNPKAASYSITLKIGRADEQIEILQSINTEEIISEMAENIELFKDGEMDLLKEKINNEDYFLNFHKLCNNLLPDGKNIHSVGIYLPEKRRKDPIILTKIKEHIKPLKSPEDETNILYSIKKGESITIQGLLQYADMTGTQEIRVVNHKGSIKIRVPEGLMDDIVRPLWDKEVIVKGKKRTKTIVDLEDIEEVK